MAKPKKKKPKKFSTRQLTEHLRELAAEVETMDDEGAVITKAEALALLLWKKALGWTEATNDGPIIHKPEAWAIQMIYERLEGKAPIAITDEKKQLTAADRVSELVRSKLNQQAKAAVAVSKEDKSVDVSDNGLAGPEGPADESPMAERDTPSG